MRGDLITPGDAGYDDSRAVYNGMIDKRPAAIARCRDVADVIACVRFGREHDIEIAVRGGGHNAGGLGVWDDALVIDLSLLRSTTVNPENHTVRADAGCTWGDVDHATVWFGMATPSDFIASTGVGGLTLGGGIGYLSALRSHRRQSSRRGCGARGRHVRDGQRKVPQRPLLGLAGRWRELRRRHVVHIPLPRHR
jgi:FAD/FMN-containing dehydrogenase